VTAHNRRAVLGGILPLPGVGAEVMGHGSSVLGVVLLLVCAVVIAALRKKPNVTGAWPVYARPVLSEVERHLHRRLVEAFPDKLILPQVQLCRFVEVRNVPGRLAVLNRYNRLSADFVICNAAAVAERVIELDDRSHDREAARSRDAKKDAVLNAAGIPIVRFQVGAIPAAADLRQLVFGESHVERAPREHKPGSRVEPTMSIP
jgi:Protein of unknown function (DUF2726)